LLSWLLCRPWDPGSTVSRLQPSLSCSEEICVFLRSSAAFSDDAAQAVSVTTAENCGPGDAITSPETFSTWIVWPEASVPLKWSVRVAVG